jgi:hypothetical protein
LSSYCAVLCSVCYSRAQACLRYFGKHHSAAKSGVRRTGTTTCTNHLSSISLLIVLSTDTCWHTRALHSALAIPYLVLNISPPPLTHCLDSFDLLASNDITLDTTITRTSYSTSSQLTSSLPKSRRMDGTHAHQRAEQQQQHHVQVEELEPEPEKPMKCH